MMEVGELKENEIQQLLGLYDLFLEDQRGRDEHFLGKSDYSAKLKEEHFRRTISSEINKIFVGKDNNSIVGFMAISVNKPNFFFDFEQHGYIYDGFVIENYRNTTLCFRLFNECEKWAKQHGCKYVTAYAFAFNERAQACFKATKMEPYKITYVKKIP